MMKRMGVFVLMMILCVSGGSSVIGDTRSGEVSPHGVVEAEYLDADWAWSHGITGTNLRIAIGSTGVDKGSFTDIHPDLAGRIAQLIDYTESDTSDGIAEDEYSGGTIGTFTSGLVAGIGANNSDAGKGMAPDSKIIMQRVADKNGNFIIPSYQTLFKDAVINQGVIFKADFSYTAGSNYTDPSFQFDKATRDSNPDVAGDQPVLCVVSSGNSGPQNNTIREPGVAKNVLTVGGLGNPRKGTQNQIMSWSGRGPTNDGRIKPDVVAPGDSVYGLKGRLFPPPPYQNLSGGSASTSLAAGAALLVYNYYVKAYGITPSPALVKASLINSAEDVNDGVPIPNNGEGWGRIRLKNVIYPAGAWSYADQNITLTTGQNATFYIRPGAINEPLKVTLVWTDPEAPNTTKGARALINDLQLEVDAPDGKKYVGNQFSGGWSVPNPAGNDSRNNVENVYIQNLINNSYKITITAKWVGKDARKDTGPIDQDFALVVSNGIFSVPPDTEPPVAKAPAPQTVAAGTVVTLDGSGSSDNVGITNYTWTFDDHGMKTLYGKIVNYKFNNVGNFEVTLTVKDAAGNSDSDTTWVNVTSSAKPLARVEVIPSSISLMVGDVFEFQAKAYDSDNTQISATFNWSVSGGIGTILQNGSFTATSAGSGKVYAEATVGSITKSGYANVTVLSKPPPGMGTVSGVVKDENSNPISGAKVTLEFSSNSTVANLTTTNAQGSYSITRSPGSYFIYAEKSGYKTSGKKLITITEGNVTNYDIILQSSVSFGTVQGKVITQDGTPIDGAKVLLLFTGNRTVANSTISGASGDYLLKGYPGTYILYAEKDGYKSEEQTITLSAGGAITRNIKIDIQTQPAGGIDLMYIALLIIILVVVVIVVVLLILRKRKKPAEPEGVSQPKPSAPGVVEKITLVYDEVCNDCQEAIKSGSEAIKCKCGKYYHIQCASSISVCPKCGTDLLSVTQQGSSPPPGPPPSPPAPQIMQQATPPSPPPPAQGQPAPRSVQPQAERQSPAQETTARVAPPPATRTEPTARSASKAEGAPPQEKGSKPEKKVLEEQFIRDLGIGTQKKRRVEDIFLLYRDGRLIKHKTTELKPMDADILSSMLTAVQEFVKDAFKSGSMNEMGYDGKRIYFAQGTYLTLAIVADASASIPDIHEKMKALLVEIEREYGTHLISWDGNVATLKFTEEYLTRLVSDLTTK